MARCMMPTTLPMSGRGASGGSGGPRVMPSSASCTVVISGLRIGSPQSMHLLSSPAMMQGHLSSMVEGSILGNRPPGVDLRVAVVHDSLIMPAFQVLSEVGFPEDAALRIREHVVGVPVWFVVDPRAEIEQPLLEEALADKECFGMRALPRASLEEIVPVLAVLFGLDEEFPVRFVVSRRARFNGSLHLHADGFPPACDEVA